MNFDDYQKKSRETALYPNLGDNLPYLGLGIAGEAGEVADKIKKLIRDDQFTGVAGIPEEKKKEIIIEIGDVLWYIAQIATELGYDLDKVAAMNTEKLQSRKQRDVLGGSGDNR